MLYLASNDKAATTLKSYQWTLRKFNGWLGLDSTLDALTTERLDNYYQQHLVTEKQYADRSLHLHWMAITGLCKWLHRNRHIAVNPLPPIQLPKPKTVVRKRLSLGEVKGLLRQCERNPHPYRRALERVILTILTTTAIRHDELHHMKVEDLFLEDCYFSILHGKGDKPRNVPLSDQCLTAIHAWLRVRPHDTQHPYLLAHAVPAASPTTTSILLSSAWHSRPGSRPNKSRVAYPMPVADFAPPTCTATVWKSMPSKSF